VIQDTKSQQQASENNEKTQQQEATPAQLKSDKETTAPKQNFVFLSTHLP
jgi:hypothetical protein